MKRLTATEIEQIRLARWRCRTDLQFLCEKVIGFKNVEKEFHGPLIASLQQFALPTRGQAAEYDQYDGKKWKYKPLRHMLDLPGKRRRLILDSRGCLKTTINTMAHTVQWLLNYPDIAIAVFQSNLDKAVEIVKAIKGIFQYNPVFRKLFPEYCPQKSIDNWGTQAQFTVEARDRACSTKESSVTALALGAGTAGKHFHVMKFSDIVEPENTKTLDRIADVKQDFNMAMPFLLVTGAYWADVEGTRYKFGDVYGDIIDQYLKDRKEGREPEYQIFARGCFKKNTPGGQPQTFSPEELDYPDLLDSNGKRIPWWPYDNEGKKRWPLEELESAEKKDIVIFNSQMRNHPVGGSDGVLSFPVSASRPAVITRDVYNKTVKQNIVYRTVTIDTAHTQKKHSKFTSICVAAWDWNNRCYIEEIVHGQWLPIDLLDKILGVLDKYRPKALTKNSRFELFMEKIPFNEGYSLLIDRAMERRWLRPDGTYYKVPIVFLPRANDTSKIDRIHSILSPYYMRGDLRFVQDLGHTGSPEENAEALRIWDHLQKELKEFPTGKYTDILDSIADQFYGKEDQMGRLHTPPSEQQLPNAMEYLKLRDMGLEDLYTGPGSTEWRLHDSLWVPQTDHWGKTGGL